MRLRALLLLIVLLGGAVVGWSNFSLAEENFLLDDDDDEEELSEEERQQEELKRLIREKRFDYVFRGIDTSNLVSRSVSINGSPMSEAELDRRVLAPIFRVEVQGATRSGGAYSLDRQYLYAACRRGREEGRWLERYPIYRCALSP